MAFHIIYLFVILAYGLWILSLSLRNEILAIFSAFLMFPLAIYIFVNGVDIFDQNNLLSIVFAAVTFALAAYTSFQATAKLMKEGL